MGNVCDAPKIQHKRTFFDEVNETKPSNNILESLEEAKNMKSKVQLEFTIEGLEKGHRYQLQVNPLDNATGVPLETETVNCHNNFITFNYHPICDFFFERQQMFQFTLIKDSISRGSIQIPLGLIIGSPGSCIRRQIDGNTNIIITAQGINNVNSYIEFIFITRNVFGVDFGKVKNKITYLISSLGRKIYSSESISYNGNFQPIKIPVGLIENGFTITFYNSEKKELGHKDENVQNFLRQKDNIYLKLKINGEVVDIIHKSNLIKNYSFVDYIRSGVAIKLTIGIDYTSSNLPPDDPLSLHYLGANKNDYEQAIEACGIIIAFYDYNQLFPVFGFGAVINDADHVDYCFNVNFRDNPEIYTIENVLKEYRNSFNNLKLAGPTNFCPLIKKAIGNIKKENNPLKYHILLILTDGIINDMQETIDALVEGSFLPLSVIIIGIGNDHFQEMIELDGDDHPITNSRGVKRKRDLVQFVPFNKYKYNPKELAAQVLEEVPRQIIEYYYMYNIYPENIQTANIISQSSFNNNMGNVPSNGFNGNNNNFSSQLNSQLYLNINQQMPGNGGYSSGGGNIYK
jgi:hypothetical protein